MKTPFHGAGGPRQFRIQLLEDSGLLPYLRSEVRKHGMHIMTCLISGDMFRASRGQFPDQGERHSDMSQAQDRAKAGHIRL